MPASTARLSRAKSAASSAALVANAVLIDAPVATAPATPTPCTVVEAPPIPDASPISDERIEEIINARSLGPRIRKLRLKRSMGLVELGHLAGMSASFLSQLETGRVVPTLRNLSRIAMVFGKPLNYFFEMPAPGPMRVSRQAARVRLTIGSKPAPHLISESMSALIPDRSLVPCIADFLPTEAGICFEPTIFEGQEFVYVVHGSVTVIVNNEQQILEPGDVAWIDGATRRHYRCTENQPARALIITRPS